MANYPQNAPDSQDVLDALQRVCESVGLAWLEDFGDDVEMAPPDSVLVVGESGSPSQEFSVSDVPLTVDVIVLGGGLRATRAHVNAIQRAIMDDRTLRGIASESGIADYTLGRLDQSPARGAAEVRFAVRYTSRGV